MSTRERARLRLIGGSQIASFIRCLQITPTQATFAQFLDKQFQSEFTGNVYTEVGNLCEDLILEEILPLIEESNKRTIHYEFPLFQLCSTPDAILRDGRVIEIKTKVRDHGRNPITAQHALQLVYYMVMRDKEFGSLIYYTPDRDFESLHLIGEYQVSLSKVDRDFFRETLVYCCRSMSDLLPGQDKKPSVSSHATVLYDYKRLFIKQLSPFTPIFIDRWPTDLGELMKSLE